MSTTRLQMPRPVPVLEGEMVMLRPPMLIQQVNLTDLARYSTIPISFVVNSVLDVSVDSSGAFNLIEQPVSEPWTKDYDIYGSPSTLPDRWDLSNWGVFLATRNSIPVAGCIIAHNTRGVDLLQGRFDLAVLWDIRVDPNHRRKGIGHRLFDASIDWAHSCNCVEMHIETQSINVQACRFYQSMGCSLSRVFRNAYDECPGEHQLIWSKAIPRDTKSVNGTT